MTKDDALDGFDILEYVLTQEYEPKNVVARLSSEINRKKGPRSKRR